jgi:hypothetical protein
VGLRFPSKEALGNAVLRHCKLVWAQTTIDDLPPDASPREQFDTYWTRLATFARTRPDEAAYADRRPVPHDPGAARCSCARPAERSGTR